MPTTRPDTARSSKTLLLSILAVAIAVCLTAASCGWDLSQEEPAETRESMPSPGNVLRFDLEVPIAELDPFASDNGATFVIPLFYSHLFVPDETGTLRPDIATEWRYDPRRFAWRFRIRQDARFHDGAPVTVENVAGSLRWAVASAPFSYPRYIRDVTPVSEDTVEVALKRDDPDLPRKIWQIPVVRSAEGAGVDDYGNPIGSGPFRFQSRQGDRKVVLVANETYYNGRPALDRIVFTHIESMERTWTRLLAGQTDIVSEITPKNREIMQRIEDKYVFDQYVIPYYSILLFNTHDPMFTDERVRKAIAHAVDREFIVADILGGAAVVSNGPMGVGSTYRNPEVHHASYNPQKALRLMEEAGWTRIGDGLLARRGHTFDFTLLVPEEKELEQRIALYLKLCLAEIGIRLDIQVLPSQKAIERYLGNHEFQAVLTEMNGAYEAYNALETIRDIWTSALKTESLAGCFDHPEVTRLIQRAVATSDPNQQKALMYEVDRLLNEAQPGVFLYHKQAIDVISKRFVLPHSFSLDVAGIYRLQYARLREGQE